MKKLIMLVVLLTTVACGTNSKEGNKNVGANLTDPKPGVPGKDGVDGQDGAAGKPGKDGVDGQDGLDSERSVNGFYTGEDFFLRITDTFYEKSYKRGDHLFRESGITSEFDSKLMFQPKVFVCEDSDGMQEFTDRTIAEQVNYYRVDLIFSAYDQLDSYLDEKEHLPSEIDAQEVAVKVQAEVVVTRQIDFDSKINEISSSQSALTLFRSENIEPVEVQLAQVNESLQIATESLTATGAQVEVASAAVAETTKLQSEKLGEVSNASDKVAQNGSDIDLKTSEVANKFAEIEDKKNSLENISNAIVAKREAIHSANSEEQRSILVAELKILESKEALLMSQLEGLVAEHKELQTQVNTLVVLRDKLDADLSILKNEYEEVTQTLAAQKTVHVELLALMEEKQEIIITINTSIESLENSLANLVSEEEDMKAKHSDLELTLVPVQDALELAQADLSEKEVELEEKKKRYAEMDQVIADQEAAIRTMENTELYKVQDRISNFKVTNGGLELISADGASISMSRTTENISAIENVPCMEAFGFLFGYQNPE